MKTKTTRKGGDMYTVKNRNNTVFTYSDPKHTKILRVDRENGEFAIYQNDKLHSEDGPALFRDGENRFFLNGVPYTTAAWIRKVTKGDTEQAAFLKLKFD